MKNLKMPTSDSWLDALIESLRDSQEAASYIEAILEEKDPEPELLRAALKDVVDARVQMNNLSEEVKVCYEKLDKLLLETGGSEIYTLVELLDALGLRIAIALRTEKDVKMPTSDSYHDYLTSSLKNSQEVSVYLGAALEETDPELLRRVFRNVVEAQDQIKSLSEQAKQHHEKLDKILSEGGGSEIGSLVELLDALGFRIAVSEAMR